MSEVKSSEFRCWYCGHFHANFIARGFNIKRFPKRCQRCRKPWPLGTPEEWLKKLPKTSK